MSGNDGEGKTPDIPVEPESLTRIVDEQLPSSLEATELQRFWSYVAVFIICVITGFCIYFVRDISAKEQGLLHSITSQGTNCISQIDLERYSKLYDEGFERSWRILDRLILGGLMSLLTLILGYIFGARHRST